MKQLPRHQKETGFTLIEIVVTLVIIAIASAIAAPSFISWLPKYRLKAAARELYTTFQHARLLAVRQNTTTRLVFDNSVLPGFYFIDLDASGTVNQAGEKRTNLTSYGSDVRFNVTPGLNDWAGNSVNTTNTKSDAFTFTGGPPPFCIYSSDGTIPVGKTGTVYLINNQNDTVYAVTTVTSGAVKLRRYNGTNWN